MKVDRVRHNGWAEAYRCAAGPLELIVVTSMGPRILSLRSAGGHNLLHEDTTDFSVGAWRLAGGHRFTIAPESEASYAPDNQPCEVRVEPAGLLILQCLGDGLLRSLQISPDLDGSGFILRHVLRNRRREPWHGAAWSITCVPASGSVVVPEPQNPPRFWNPPGGGYAEPSSAQWRMLDDCCVIVPRGQRGKIGLRSVRGWLAWLGPDSTFVIRGPVRDPHATYPDEGCNLEVYTCTDYIELETLGPLTTLLPGQEWTHVERWQLLPRAFSRSAWRGLAQTTWSRRAHRSTAGVNP